MGHFGRGQRGRVELEGRIGEGVQTHHTKGDQQGCGRRVLAQIRLNALQKLGKGWSSGVANKGGHSGTRCEGRGREKMVPAECVCHQRRSYRSYRTGAERSTVG